MPPEIIFALLSLVFLGVSDFLYKWGQRWDLRGGPFMLLQNLAFLPTALALAYYRDEIFWSPWLWLGFANGIFAFTAFLFVLLALRWGEAVVLTPIVRLNFAVTAALTVSLLGEAVSFAKGVALLLAALAVLTAGGAGLTTGGDRRAFLLALSAMGLFGFVGLFYKLSLNMGAPPAGMTVAQSVGVFCVALPFAIQRGDSIPRQGVPLWLPLVCGVLTSCSYVALAVGMSYGDAVVVAPIAQLSFVLTVVLAVVLLKERLTLRKGFGVVFAILTVFIFASA
ncbi:MAG: EamA family transporter [Acidiferrobacterales bacterium]